MTTDEIKAALTAAQRDQQAASARIAELQSALSKPVPFVRALRLANDPGYHPRLFHEGDNWVSTIYADECREQDIDPADLANAMRLSMCMRDWLIRFVEAGGCSPIRANALLHNQLHWLAAELDINNHKQHEGSTDRAARTAGWIV